MIVVTTPMCRKIVEWAGLDEFKINKHPDKEDGDFAILLSESKVQMDSLAIKINTFSQIRESIKAVSNCLIGKGLIEKAVGDDEIDEIFKSYGGLDIGVKFALLDESEFDAIRRSNEGKKLKVYSEFLKDLVSDIGATVIDFKFDKDNSSNSDLDYDYLVFPDYLEEDVLKNEGLDECDLNFIRILTHNNISKDPILKAESRYSTLIDGMK